MNEDEFCESCGQKTSGYRSAVSKGTVAVLKKIYHFVEKKGLNTVHLVKEMGAAGILSANEVGNANSHMVRQGLLAHIESEPGNFALTAKAVGFLNGAAISKWVRVAKRTKGNPAKTIETSQEICVISDFDRGGEYWEVPGFEIKEGRIIRPPTMVL